MPATMTFGDILDAADALPLEDQQELARLLSRRIAAASRQRLVDAVQASRAEFADGLAVEKTVDEIMAEIER